MIIRRAMRQPMACSRSIMIRIKDGRMSIPFSRRISTAPFVHVPVSLIQSKYQNPSLYDPQSMPPVNRVANTPTKLRQRSTVPTHIKDPDTLVTLYAFPSFEPLEFMHYPATHLCLPLRRDILHRAVIYEGDRTRTDTAHTITRREHPGSGRKLAPQKGQGRARVGDSSSPVRSTGVKVFGPKLRDFATGLPRKMYDLAWRTALSYRYRKGELLVVDKLAKEEFVGWDALQVSKMVEAFNGTNLGSAAHPRRDEITKEKPLRTMWVLSHGGGKKDLFGGALREWYPKDVVKNVEDVDVKNLLEGKRIVIERDALNHILRNRQSDIPAGVDVARRRAMFQSDAVAMAQAVQSVAEQKKATEQLAEQEHLQLQQDLQDVLQAGGPQEGEETKS